MRHVTILVHHAQTNLSAIVGIHEVFEKANLYWKKQGKGEVLKIELAGTASAKRIDFAGGLFSVKPQRHFSSIRKTNLIIIPSANPAVPLTDNKNKLLLQWLRQQYDNGAEVASICSGAFMLASTGLLNGKNCSTHWALAGEFRKRFPEVNLQTDRLITDENGIYTNGGAYSFLNLLIYMVEKFYDRSTAIYCAKVFQVDIDRMNQSSFAIFTGQKAHGDEMVIKAQDYIESKVTEKISAEELASRFAI